MQKLSSSSATPAAGAGAATPLAVTHFPVHTSNQAPLWPFLSTVFPLLASDQIENSPSRSEPSQPPAPVSPLIIHPLANLKSGRISLEAEHRIRHLYISLIEKSGRLLDLPQLTIATACVYWHRFFSRHSLLSYHPSLCASAAIFLASKFEENNRRVRDIINVVYRMEHLNTPPPPTAAAANTNTNPQASPHHPANSSAASPARYSTTNPSTAAAATTLAYPPSTAYFLNPSSAPKSEPLEVSPLFWDLKEEVLRFEQKLLRVLAFEMKIYHPHIYVLHFARELECSEEVARVAWYIANDSLKTTLCLQYGPHAIACAALYLASEIMAEQIRFTPAVIKEASTTSSATGAGGNASASATATAPPAGLNASSASPYRPAYPMSSPIGPSGLSNPSQPPSLLSSAVVAGAGGVSSAPLLQSTLIQSTSHSSEWWEYFGSVNQLQMEDISHQLLAEYEREEGEDCPELWGSSIHLELTHLAQAEDNYNKQQLLGEAIGARSVREEEGNETPSHTGSASSWKRQAINQTTNRRPSLMGTPSFSGMSGNNPASTPNIPSSAAASAAMTDYSTTPSFSATKAPQVRPPASYGAPPRPFVLPPSTIPTSSTAAGNPASSPSGAPGMASLTSYAPPSMYAPPPPTSTAHVPSSVPSYASLYASTAKPTAPSFPSYK